MPDYANVLVKVVAIFGVINRVPATTPAHNVFLLRSCAYLNSPNKLAFGPKSGFKNKCRVRACDFGFGSGSGLQMRSFYNSVWVCMHGSNWEFERIQPPPTNSKNRLKSR